MIRNAVGFRPASILAELANLRPYDILAFHFAPPCCNTAGIQTSHSKTTETDGAKSSLPWNLQWEKSVFSIFSIGETDTALIRYQASPRDLADAGLLASALPNNFAVIVRLTKVGTNASMKRCSRPGTILDGFSRSALRPSDTHCSKLVGFIGMIRGSNPSLASTGRSMKHI